MYIIGVLYNLKKQLLLTVIFILLNVSLCFWCISLYTKVIGYFYVLRSTAVPFLKFKVSLSYLSPSRVPMQFPSIETISKQCLTGLFLNANTMYVIENLMNVVRLRQWLCRSKSRRYEQILPCNTKIKPTNLL